MARPQIIDWVENNFGVTECNFYDTIRDGAYGAALGSALTGQFWLTGGLALVGGAAQLTAEMAGCNKPRLPDTEGDCWTAADGVPGLLQFLENRPCAGGPDDWASTSLMALEVTEVEAFPREDDGTIASKVTFIDANGITQVRIYDHRCAKAAKYRIANCTDPVVPIPPHKPGEPIADPVTTTTDDGCTWTMQATDSYVDQSGQWHTYYTVTADNDACGGPFAYWSSSNGPQWVAPKPPGPDGPEPPVPPPDHKPEPTPCPDPCAPCPDPSPCPDPCPDPCPEIPDPISLPASTYQLTGVCEDVAEGELQPVREWEIPANRYEQALAARIDALAAMLQQHLEWRTPTCNSNKPELWRHWRSIRFESDEYTPNGKRRLSKLFRYRGSSPGDVGRVADHWKDFRWVTGATIVSHEGSPVGSPQVWARDADEGKRVIRHAFLEAGTDADSVGEWRVTGPTGSRTGVSLEVGLLCVDGCWSATARPGSSGWPEAAVVRPDP